MRDRDSTTIYRCIQSEKMYDGSVREIVIGPYPTKQWLMNSNAVHGKVVGRQIQMLEPVFIPGVGCILGWVDI